MNKKYTYVLFSSLLALPPLGLQAQKSVKSEVGTLTAAPIFSETFDKEDDFKKFTVQNYNGGAAWQYDSGNQAAVITHGLDEYKPACDDWLISPAIKLKKGNKYTLKFHIWGVNGFTTFRGEYAIALGTGDDPKQYKTIKERTELRSNGEPDQTPDQTFTVDSDGEYHIGFHCTNERGNDYSEVSMFVDDISIIESSSAAPSAVEDFKVKTDGSNLKATISFKAPSTDLNGDKLSSIDKITVKRNGEVIKSIDKPEPGKEYSVADDAPTAGKNKWDVVAQNENGEGNVASVSAWVGPDTPKQITDLTVSRNASGNAVLSWKAPESGVNGGYIAPETLKYTITRLPDGKVVSEGKSEKTFTDTSDKPESGQVYKYSIEATTSDGSLKSSALVSNGIYLGKAYSIPYSEDFSKDPTTQYTVIDANSDGNTWEWNEQAGAMTNKYSWTSDADEWLLTPKIKLDGGWAYTLSYKAAANEGHESQTEKISAAIGKNGVTSDFTEIVPVKEYRGGQYSETKMNFNIKETGDYQVGFHLTSAALMWGVWFDDVKIDKFVKLSAPDSVTNIRVVAADAGKLSATVKFNAPSVNAGKEKLSAITKIDLWRGDSKGESLTLVHTFETPKPGEEITYTDDKAGVGYNYYYIRAYNADGEDGEGVMASASEYVGEDIPVAPTSTKATDNFDGTIHITWKAPEAKGVHGKWVDTKNLTYTVYSVEGQSYTKLATVKGGVTEADVPLTQQGPQVRFGYAVVATTAGGSGAVSATSNIMTGGAAYELPMKESFTGGVMSKAWWGTYDNEHSMMQPYTYMASDNDGGSFIYYNVSGATYDATLTGGKIRTENGQNLQLSFDYWVTKGKPASIKVDALKPDGTTVQLKAVEVSESDGQWKTATIDASGLSTEKYVQLKFTFGSSEKESYIAIDNILMKELLQYDLGVNSISTPYKVDAGKDIRVSVKVENNATEAAVGDDYSVELYVNGEKALETPGEDIEPNDSKDFNFNIPTSVNDKEAVEVYAKIAYDYDLQDRNNTSDTKQVVIYESGYPVIDDLAAIDNKLTWTAPKSSEKSVLEDFEGYSNGQISGLDPWTLYDNDGVQTIASMLGASLSLPNYNQPMAYIIFNPEESGLNLDFNPGLVAHSGSQFLSSFAGFDKGDYKFIAHDDMLVSPELSGEEQTITFWVKSLTSDLPESFQVLTSSTTNELGEFISLPVLDVKESTPEEWTEYNVKLPEGTKYFAIRNYGTEPTSTGYEFMLDDIKYNVAAPAVTGYNIYRDGSKIGSVKVSEPMEFNAESGHTYNVTATFDDGGESRFSNDVKIGATGIETVDNESEYGRIRTSDGNISVNGVAGRDITVFAIDGTKVYSGKSTGNDVINVPSGQYIVRIGTKAVNVVVK